MSVPSHHSAPIVCNAYSEHQGGPGMPRRVLMTTDAVGGVWRYSIELAQALGEVGIEVVLTCLGPAPSAEQREEAGRLGGLRLVVLEAPLDWMVPDETALQQVPDLISALAEDVDADLLHLNLPSQACGMKTRKPVVVVSHSCVVTWWDAMRGTELPHDWKWLREYNRRGFARADRVLVPTQAYARALERAYGPVDAASIVPNAVTAQQMPGVDERDPFVFAAGRWWDEGKNAATLDLAAAGAAWPVRMAGACRGGADQSYDIRNAEWVGELSYDHTRAAMRRAGIFASPSLYEPFGLAALEAAADGAPLILADIPTYRELWTDAALFADPHDAASFRSAIDRLAGDAALRGEFATAARQRARMFTRDRQRQAVLEAYNSAMPRRVADPVSVEGVA